MEISKAYIFILHICRLIEPILLIKTIPADRRTPVVIQILVIISNNQGVGDVAQHIKLLDLGGNLPLVVELDRVIYFLDTISVGNRINNVLIIRHDFGHRNQLIQMIIDQR
ncbi:hypothetical protein D3C73_1439040 [compost metagenome]